MCVVSIAKQQLLLDLTLRLYKKLHVLVLTHSMHICISRDAIHQGLQAYLTNKNSSLAKKSLLFAYNLFYAVLNRKRKKGYITNVCYHNQIYIQCATENDISFD